VSDPVRQGPAPAADALSGVERDERVEQLLLQGLDAYFTGEYEGAVHVWTRVLFLDRGHARARAYIERARSAQAERQRESEELLHRGVAAFDRGDATDARELLEAAVSRGASPDVADQAEAPALVAELPAHAQSPARDGWRRTAALALVLAAGGAVALLVVTVLLDVSDVRDALKLSRDAAVAHPAAEEAVPVPRVAELALTRARTQYAGGHAADALRTMEAIPDADPLRAEADRLRAEIQRALLAAAPVPVAPPAPAARVP
jgi:tetratricopeptide (TPR) repeat protein